MGEVTHFEPGALVSFDTAMGTVGTSEVVKHGHGDGLYVGPTSYSDGTMWSCPGHLPNAHKVRPATPEEAARYWEAMWAK